MTELRYEAGDVGHGRRPVWAGRLRRPALLLAVTILCGAAYLVGIWTGMRTHVTCATTSPGQIVCSSDGIPAPPEQPREQGQGSA